MTTKFFRKLANTILAALALLCVHVSSSLAQTPVLCGQTVTNITTEPDQVDQYTYAGTAGQVLSLALWGPISCAYDYMVADIYNPSGQLIASLYPDCNTGGALNLALTNSGTYKILVHEYLYRATTSYSLSLQSVIGGGCDGRTITCGQTVVTNTAFNTQMDAYSYAGTAGQVLSIALWGPITCAYDTMVADIYSPDGQLLTTLTPPCNTGGALNLTLTNSGTYTIVVHEYFYRYTASYSLSLQSVTGGGCNGRTITCGETVASSTAVNSQMDAYSYAGIAGQVLSLALHGPISCAYDFMVADIYNPDGQLLVTLTPECNIGGALNLTLTNSGSFTIVVHDYVYRRTGSYTMSLQSVIGGGCGRTITCGDTVEANTTFNSQMDAYSYAGTAGQVLSIALYGPISCAYDYMVADIYNPSGQLVSSLASLCNGGNALNLTLTNTGTFTILVHEYIYRATGNYTLGLTVSNGCVGLCLGSANVRTQQVVCLPLEIISASPAVWLSFTVHAPPGILSNATLNVTGQFTNATITSGSNCEWFVTMQTSPTDGVVGDQVIGSVCFEAVSTQSAFSQLVLNNLVVTNEDGTVAGATTCESRSVVIANQALLEATLTTNSQRMLTLYGKASTDYVIEYATNLTVVSAWLPGWTNTVPASLSYTTPVPDALSNSPVLFLRAKER